MLRDGGWDLVKGVRTSGPSHCQHYHCCNFTHSLTPLVELVEHPAGTIEAIKYCVCMASLAFISDQTAIDLGATMLVCTHNISAYMLQTSNSDVFYTLLTTVLIAMFCP
jgi:hypothetical protein